MTCIDGSVILSVNASYFNGSLSYLLRHTFTPADLVLPYLQVSVTFIS